MRESYIEEKFLDNQTEITVVQLQAYLSINFHILSTLGTNGGGTAFAEWREKSMYSHIIILKIMLYVTYRYNINKNKNKV